MRRLPREPRYLSDDDHSAATAIGNTSIDEAAANLLRSLQDISNDSDGEETPRTFNWRLREAAISGSSFPVSPLHAGSRARMLADGQPQMLPSSFSMPDLSNTASSSATRGLRLRNAGLSLLQQRVSEQPGHQGILHCSPRSAVQDTRVSLEDTWERDWAPRRKDRQLRFEDEQTMSKDDWLLPAALIAPATSSTAASSGVSQGYREVGHVREELLSLTNLHTKTEEEFSNLNRQLSWTQTELQKREHVQSHRAQEQNDELLKLRAGLSETLVDRDRLQLEVTQAWAERARLKTQLLNVKDQTDQRPDAEKQKAEHATLHLELNQCKTDLAQAQKESDQWESEVMHIRPEIQQHQSDLCNLRMKLSQALAEPSQYKMELVKSREETGRLEAELQHVRWRHAELCSELPEALAKVKQSTEVQKAKADAEPCQLRSEFLEALADLDQSKAGLREAELQQAVPELERPHNHEPAELRSELLEALSELDQSRTELEQVRLQSCAAAAAEDELPKVLAHCSRQEKWLQQLWHDFSAAQDLLAEKGKALEELNGWNGGVSNGQLMSSAYSTMRSIRSADASLRSTMRDTMSDRKAWALEGGRNTWGEWPHLQGNKHCSQALARAQTHMSRSQVSFQFDKSRIDEE